MAFLLGLSGVVVVARDQVFLGAALSQASLLGIALVLTAADSPLLADVELVHAPWLAPAVSVAVSAAAAWFAAGGGGRRAQTAEARTGWVYLVGASAALVAVTWSPHGPEEVHSIAFSSLIAASPLDAATFGALALVAAVTTAAARRRLVLLLLDPGFARAVGIRETSWNTVLALWLGIIVGLAVRTGGMLFTFGCLALPAMAARALLHRTGPVFVAAPIVAVGGTALASVLAHCWDLPPGQLSVLVLAAALPAASAADAIRRR
jgi:ABC-type Mn2+/Zn2+ transport system permease subunit